ncbi:MFS transporter [Robbsia sp. KACC 23696]|uniref:MFS transporter n=1 Tax=Robbsia sp. KACC 23696 TaxID=3149231 RepID=UPI00325A75D4
MKSVDSLSPRSPAFALEAEAGTPPTSGQPHGAASRSLRKRDIVAANIGAFFEWFDLLVYAMFALTISKLFFPTTDPKVATLLSLLTFASSYLVRPVGAVVLGIYADKHGRRAAMSLAATLMLLGTLLMAFVPTYAHIGVLAPALLVFGRLLQGFSVGGEFGSANSYLTEQHPKWKAMLGSLQFSVSGFAVMLSSLFALSLNHILTPAQVESWGWRTPFIFGLLIGPVGVYMRKRIQESAAFENEAPRVRTPLAETFHSHVPFMLIGLMIVAAGNVASFLNIYMPTFAQRSLGISKDIAFTASICSGIVATIVPVFGGYVADRFGTRRVMGIALVIGLCMLYPLFYLLTHSPSFGTLALFQCAMSFVFYSFYYAPVSSVLSQLFPTSCRTTAVSITYVGSQLLFGGITPLVVNALVDASGSVMAPAWYVTGIGVISLLGLYLARKRVD